jgi:hypothetical protein
MLSFIPNHESRRRFPIHPAARAFGFPSILINHHAHTTMPTAPDNPAAHDYAERIRERLPRRLQELRERCGLSKYGLARESGLSRGYIAKRRAVMPGFWWGSLSRLHRAPADFSEVSGVA